MNANTPAPRNRLRLVFRTFCVSFVIFCLISAALLVLRPRIYFSEAVVEFSGSATNSVASEETEPTGNLRRRIETEMRVIESPELQKRVVEDLQLEAVWGKRYNGGKRFPPRECLEMLHGRTSIRSRRDAPVITIRVYSDVPVESAKIADSIAQNYRNTFTESRHINSMILKPMQPSDKVSHRI
jgi:uncharacterized protein involved in exopolysaccharide biosynthesis